MSEVSAELFINSAAMVLKKKPQGIATNEQNSKTMAEEEVMAAEVDEATFYTDEQGVRVTSARLIVGSKTYAMRNITSVSTRRTRPSYVGPLIALLLGLGFATAGCAVNPRNAMDIIFGALIASLSVLWCCVLKPDHHLQISSSAGESSALASKRKDYIDEIARAINEAIIHRG